MGEAGEDKIVWIFGAGFSKPLGGPLLSDFFSPRFVAIAQGLLELQSGPWKGLEVVAIAYDLLLQDHLVTDPEDFLNVLDTGQDDENPQSAQCRSLLRRLKGRGGRIFASGLSANFTGTNEEVSELSASARLQIACSCESFVPVDPRDHQIPEQWKPYERWADNLLGPGDTVVTFNYDRAVEWIAGERISALLPAVDDFRRQRELERGRAQLLKLHGSANWFRNEEGFVDKKTPAELREWFGRPDGVSNLAIGVPGPGKGSLSATLFQPLWAKAQEAIAAADAVVIVGYRMPDSDGNAMALLSDGLRAGDPGQLVHLVLGPDIEAQDTKRVRGYLGNILDNRGIGLQPWAAYAEGFFNTIPDRSALLR